MDLETLINKCLAKKDMNKEFALFYVGEWSGKPWRAEIGNPSSHVMLGEIEGEVTAEGDTALEAVQNLFEAIP